MSIYDTKVEIFYPTYHNEIKNFENELSIFLNFLSQYIINLKTNYENSKKFKVLLSSLPIDYLIEYIYTIKYNLGNIALNFNKKFINYIYQRRGGGFFTFFNKSNNIISNIDNIVKHIDILKIHINNNLLSNITTYRYKYLNQNINNVTIFEIILTTIDNLYKLLIKLKKYIDYKTVSKNNIKQPILKTKESTKILRNGTIHSVLPRGGTKKPIKKSIKN